MAFSAGWEKVSGNVCEVRIAAENPHGGWDGINVLTNGKVRIKSAQRLRGLVDRPKKRKTITTLEEHEAEVAADNAAKTAQIAEDRPGAKKAKTATKDAKAATERNTVKRCPSRKLRPY